MSKATLRGTVFCCLNLILLTACAGPMSPFGAINGWVSRIEETDLKPGLWNGRDTRVRFQPAHQVLHGPSEFSVVIEDPDGVPEDHWFKLTYNGIDVTAGFLAQAERKELDLNGKRVKLTLPTVRLLLAGENHVKAAYQHSVQHRPVAATFEPPSCSAFEEGRSLASVPTFSPPDLMVQMINQQSLSRNLNPFYVAGLIAQESGFDPRAISSSRALGLTQVTSAGEAEILRVNGTWPRYQGIDEMPLPVLRMAILNGKINATNEWRLNPALSIKGGVEYLSYLSEYWSRPEKRALIEKNLGDSDLAFSEVLLASYNSGAKRVSAALVTKGPQYLQDEELGEARKYVKRVSSYCSYFANKEE